RPARSGPVRAIWLPLGHVLEPGIHVAAGDEVSGISGLILRPVVEADEHLVHPGIDAISIGIDSAELAHEIHVAVRGRKAECVFPGPAAEPFHPASCPYCERVSSNRSHFCLVFAGYEPYTPPHDLANPFCEARIRDV